MANPGSPASSRGPRGDCPGRRAWCRHQDFLPACERVFLPLGAVTFGDFGAASAGQVSGPQEGTALAPAPAYLTMGFLGNAIPVTEKQLLQRQGEALWVRDPTGPEGRTSVGRTCWVPGRALSLAQFSAQAPCVQKKPEPGTLLFVLFQILSFHFSLPYTENTSQVQPHQVAEREGMGPSRWTPLASQRSDCRWPDCRWPGHVMGAASRLGVDPVALQGPCLEVSAGPLGCKDWVSRQPLHGTGQVGPASHTPEARVQD